MAYLSKEEQIEELVYWIVECMDMDALEEYAREHLAEYYSSLDGEDDFKNNYEEMKEIKGDD